MHIFLWNKRKGKCTYFYETHGVLKKSYKRKKHIGTKKPSRIKKKRHINYILNSQLCAKVVDHLREMNEMRRDWDRG